MPLYSRTRSAGLGQEDGAVRRQTPRSRRLKRQFQHHVEALARAGQPAPSFEQWRAERLKTGEE